MNAHAASPRAHDRTRDADPLACSALDAALFMIALALSTQYALALASLGQEVMWGRVHAALFWLGLLGAPFAPLAPAWLFGRFTRVNTVWPAIGLSLPPAVWSVGLTGEPAAMALVGAGAIGAVLFTILPARAGARRRAVLHARRGRCARCGYDLSGLGGGTCPECGLSSSAGTLD